MKKLEISFSPVISLMFMGAIAISATIGVFIYSSFKSQDEADWWVNHTYKVLGATSQLRIDLSDLESDTRAFALTRQSQFLNNFNQRAGKTFQDFKALEILTRDGRNKTFRPREIENLLARRLTLLKTLVAVAEDKNFTFSQLNSRKLAGLIREGGLIRSVLNTKLDNVESEEVHLLDRRILQLKLVGEQTRMLVYTGKITAVILLIICFLKLNAEGIRRIKAEREQALLNDALEKQVKNLDTLNHNLNTVNRELETFSYSVSHDLRAPLRSIDGFSQALLDFYNDKLDEEGKDYLNRIRNNTQRMAQLIDDMLQLSRLTRTELQIETVNMSAIAEELVQELRIQNPGREVDCTIEPDMKVKGDKSLLYALVQNLLVNAWKFTSKHDRATIVFNTIQDKDGKTIYRVKDDGAGFEMDFVDKLFGAFQRLHGMTEFKGTGIGLATCQRIVHRHGGKIWAEGEVEKGATFFFTLST